MPKSHVERREEIRALILSVSSEQPILDEKALRKACLDRLDIKSGRERQSYAGSIRYAITQMQRSGELNLAPSPAESGGAESPEPTAEPQLEVVLTEESIPSEPIPAAPAAPREKKQAEKKPAAKTPKAKDMKQYLAEVLSEDVSLSEDRIASSAVGRFGVSGEQVNGVKGLAKQVLTDSVRDGWIVQMGDGYRLAPQKPDPAPLAAEQPAAPAPAEKPAPPAPKPAPEKKAPAPDRRAPERKPEAPRSEKRISMNAKSFADLLHRRHMEVQGRTGDNTFFAEYAARLLEAYFKAKGLRVSGRFVVDGAEDKGVDVILHTVDELGIGDVVYLQVKARADKVTVKDLRELCGVMATEHATRAVFVTTSTFTTDAVNFVHANRSLGAIDKYKLFELARTYRFGLTEENGTLLPTADILG